jgi:hypothetical protein
MEVTNLKPSIADAVTKVVEGDNRALSRGNGQTDLLTFEEDPFAAGAKSIADIEKLMAELLVTRDYLQAEGERLRRINANYAHLAQTASASVKVITESIGRWRTSEQEVANSAAPMVGRVMPPPLKASDVDVRVESEAT